MRVWVMRETGRSTHATLRMGSCALRHYAGRMSRPRLLVLLYAAAVAVSSFTVLRGIDPFDEGFVLAAAARVADGQMPYADFMWPYGPGHPYLLAGASEVFGNSLLWWRLVRIACDAGVALLVFVLARRHVPLAPALAAWLCSSCAMAQPVSANPFPVALLLGLAGFALATAPESGRRAVLWAGLLVGIAAAWRLDFGLYAGGAVTLATVLAPGSEIRDRAGRLNVFAGAASLTGLALYAPFIVAAGPGDTYEALIGASSRERSYWTLPFPLSYDGSLRGWPPGALAEDLKDALGFYVPLIVTAGFAVAALGCLTVLRGGARSIAWQLVGLLVLGAGSLLYLLSRTDEFHANPGIVVLAVVLPAAAWSLWELGNPARTLAVGTAWLFALLLVYGVANRTSALLQPQPYDSLDLPLAHGVKARPVDAKALPEVVRLVQRLVPAGEPIYAATARSDIVRYNNPLLYVLTDRPNVLPRDVGLFAKPRTQRRIVARLRSAKPRAIVRWNDPISAAREPNLRGRPSGSRAVDEFLASEYRVRLRRGLYDVLVPRHERGSS